MPILRSKSYVYSLFAVMLGLLSACASSPPKSEVDFKEGYDFSPIKTVAFLKATPSGDSAMAMLSDMQINRIDKALGEAMESKGLRVVEDQSQADALVNWHLATQEKTDVHSYNTGSSMSMGMGMGGYGHYNRASMYNCWNCGGTEVSVSNYTEGTFIVDVIDPALQQSVWRSVTQSRLKGQLKKDPAAIKEAALRIMAGFPPSLTTGS